MAHKEGGWVTYLEEEEEAEGKRRPLAFGVRTSEGRS